MLTRQWFQTYKTSIEALALFTYFTVNGVLNAITVVMEYVRMSNQDVSYWEPFVWEVSSGWSALLLFPAIAYFTRRFPWRWQHIGQTIGWYFLGSVLFSLFHVSVMVSIREIVYWFADKGYDFATDLSSLGFELLYELRQDIWSFLFYVVIIGIYRYSLAQWMGDATPVNEEESQSNEPDKQLPERLLVKKLGKEFLIQTSNIEWLESSGNYLNLHIGDSVYPMRMSMSQFESLGESRGFVRIHRSFIVNTHCIEHMKSLPSGDAEVVLSSGKQVRMSRRFRKEFEQKLQQSISFEH